MSHLGPKKKHEYFGRGRASSSTSDYHSDTMESLSDRDRSVLDSPPSSAFSSMIINTAQSPFDYSSTAMPLPPLSSQPLMYTSPYPDGAQSLGMVEDYHRQHSEGSSSYASGPFVPLDMHREFARREEGAQSLSRDIPPIYNLDEEDDFVHISSPNNRQKRTQRCRMCANHNKIVEMKGHKWYCEFRNCACDNCDVTRKCQKYMKERQKLTRTQQQQQQHPENLPFDPQMGRAESSRRRSSVDQNQINFPRVEEMVNETKDIYDSEFLDQVNQLCRPKSSNMRH